MEIPIWWVAVAFLIGAAVAGAAVQWWFGRKLGAVIALNARLDKARQFAAQQASQARKQIELLQQDIAVLRLAAAKRGQRSDSMPATAVLPSALDGDDAADGRRPELPADGFADTQVLPASRR